MSIEHEPDWNIVAQRTEAVLADLEAAARVALAQNRYRPGITALAEEVTGLRAAIAAVREGTRPPCRGSGGTPARRPRPKPQGPRVQGNPGSRLTISLLSNPSSPT